MTQETIVAIYDSAYAAGAACAELIDAGLPDDAVTWTSAASAQTAACSRPRRERSFWSTLFGGEPPHDTVVYDRSVESGSDVLTVRVPGEHIATCIAILEKHRPIDIDERARSYRLTPRDPAADDTIYDGVHETQPLLEQPLSEQPSSGEPLWAGRRLVDRGTTRVRRYVVELPVEQDLAVRAGPVAVEGSPVSDAAPVPEASAAGVVTLVEMDEVSAAGRVAARTEDATGRRAATDPVGSTRGGSGREEAAITRADDTIAPLDRAQPR